jgi:hypothetical protein
VHALKSKRIDRAHIYRLASPAVFCIGHFGHRASSPAGSKALQVPSGGIFARHITYGYFAGRNSRLKRKFPPRGRALIYGQCNYYCLWTWHKCRRTHVPRKTKKLRIRLARMHARLTYVRAYRTRSGMHAYRCACVHVPIVYTTCQLVCIYGQEIKSPRAIEVYLYI